MPKKYEIRVLMQPCGGVNPRTGLRVGSRHRWPDGWGEGYCKWCGHDLEYLQRKYRVYLGPKGKIIEEKS